MNSQKGFTIVELLIATTVLSTILVIVTIVMVGIGNLYYKGVNQARIQSSARDVTDELSQKLQLNDGVKFSSVPPGGANPVGRVCIGTTRYSYVLNKQIGANDVGSGIPIRHVLWKDTVPVEECDTFTGFWSNANPGAMPGHGEDGVELIAPRSRLSSFSVTRATDQSPYHIVIGMAYGDGDLLCNTTVGGDCDVDTTEADATHHAALENVTDPYDIICRGRIGGQFCATSALITTVVKRL